MTPLHPVLKSVGILGGGQLALMLANAAVKMGRRPIILAKNSSEPAALVHPNAIFGSVEDENVLRDFFSQVHTVIFENEFINCEKLKRVAQDFDLVFSPRLEVLALLQDKLNQKEILKKLGIPTADFAVLDLSLALKSQLKVLFQRWGGGLVLKWSRMGYDGKGVLLIQDSAEDFQRAAEFCKSAGLAGSAVYAERRIDFKRELALVAVQSIEMGFVHYPLVISEQENGICSRVYGPAHQWGVSAQLEKQAQDSAKKLAQFMGLSGTFAIEFFETSAGELLVNEIAPRVHNSGHYTQNACPTDQFENHIRASLGIPLGSVEVKSHFAMLNLLGPDERVGVHAAGLLPEPGSRSHLHWYGKSEIRPRRKLGHLNGNVIAKELMKDLFKELEVCRQRWLSRLKN